MRQPSRWSQLQFGANLRLLSVVCASVFVAAGAMFMQAGGSLRERLWGGLLVALAPACIAWPRLFRGFRSRSALPPPTAAVARALAQRDLAVAPPELFHGPAVFAADEDWLDRLRRSGGI